jgi:hypothetical protein
MRTRPVTVGCMKSQAERAVLVISSTLMWIPCLLLCLVGAPLWIAGLLALSAGTMTMQVATCAGGTGRFSRMSARLFRV